MAPDEIRAGLEDALSILEGPDPDELWPDWRSRSIEFRRTWLRKLDRHKRLAAGAPAAGTRTGTPDGNSIPARNPTGAFCADKHTCSAANGSRGCKACLKSGAA